MNHTLAVCRHNEMVAPGYYRMGLSCPDDFASSQPGQFVMVGFPKQLEPLLHRPFSIHALLDNGINFNGIEILYKVIGTTTRKLSKCREGETLSILGPLGKGFTLSHDQRRIFMVAGGIGVAPFVFLSQRLGHLGFEMSHCHIFLGGRTRNDIICLDFFRSLGCHVHISTDDGSFGDHCLIVQPVEKAFSSFAPDVVYACGPEPMLRCVAAYAKNHDVPCQVSMETMMACGMGVCLGCAISDPRQPSRYLHVCKDGPVFDGDMLNALKIRNEYHQ